ncbi:MAG: response regulator transcription factor [Leptonema sp. (in: Bacteria)]|nr:response regulator transcription factor [Leptonema sp. (in: bacteria)]
MKPLLLVDDNDRYAAILDEYFTNLGYSSDRARDGQEGYQLFIDKGKDYYPVIVTDITMESQMAGIHMLRKIHNDDYQGTVVVASTGFDFPGATTLTRLVLSGIGIDFLIPKTSVLKKDPIFYSMQLFDFAPQKFVEKLR